MIFVSRIRLTTASDELASRGVKRAMTYGELERTLGCDVVRRMEDTLGQAFFLAETSDTPAKYNALLELMTALLAASVVSKECDAAARARVLAGRLVSLVDESLSLIEADRRRRLS